jgi:hypothetical protein
MTSDSRLDPAWNNYLLTRDCLRIAQRVAKRGDARLFRGTLLEGKAKIAAHIEESHRTSDEFVIVALWAEFERFLIIYLQGLSQIIGGEKPQKLTAALQQQVGEEIERWRLDDVLDLFKTIVDGQRIGEAKNVKKFRDWVAHKNPNKPPPAKIDPRTAYQLLAAIIADIEKKTSKTQRTRRRRASGPSSGRRVPDVTTESP